MDEDPRVGSQPGLHVRVQPAHADLRIRYDDGTEAFADLHDRVAGSRCGAIGLVSRRRTHAVGLVQIALAGRSRRARGQELLRMRLSGGSSSPLSADSEDS